MGSEGEGEALRIVRLEAHNFKRLRVVDIHPPAGVVVVGGKNGAGKSSVLDAILAALGGRRLAPPVPIRLGTQRAEVVLDLGEFEVLRTWTAGGDPQLHVRGRDGKPHAKPQALLDSLLGPFIDPLAFTRLPGRDQRRMLLELIDLGGFSLEESEAREKEAAEARRALGRDVAQLEAELRGYPGSAPPAAADLPKLMQELEAAQRAEGEGKRLADKLEALEQERGRQTAALLEAERTVDRINLELSRITSAMNTTRAAIAATPAPRNPEEIQARARAAREAERAAERWTVAEDLRRRLAAAREEQASAARKIETEQASRAAALERAKLPLAGLGLEAEGLTYNGVPLGQASQAEQLRVSVALAMARRPRLRVLRVQEASLLDADHLAIMRELAEAHGFQLWLEMVGDSGDVVIEDGTVAGAKPVCPVCGVELYSRPVALCTLGTVCVACVPEGERNITDRPGAALRLEDLVE